MNKYQLEAKESKRDNLVKFLESLNFKTDKITDIMIRDKVAVLIDLMGVNPDNQIVSAENGIVLVSSWRSDKVNKELEKDIQKDSKKMYDKIKDNKDKEG
ncbi:hypothetical protein KAR91_79770 [Candidatus Pacearchaeota archaeon]|nr:hypothetical protein [Candidatus Pacearchaeota archaeon]